MHCIEHSIGYWGHLFPPSIGPFQTRCFQSASSIGSPSPCFCSITKVQADVIQYQDLHTSRLSNCIELLAVTIQAAPHQLISMSVLSRARGLNTLGSSGRLQSSSLSLPPNKTQPDSLLAAAASQHNIVRFFLFSESCAAFENIATNIQ